MFLDQDLAQEIVDRTMDVIDFNVNVMNKRGLIVGSGDRGRVNTLHEGALIAITQNRKVTIDAASSRTLRGVQPGVNLPLHHQGEVIGVVGITGEPKNVEICGELLKVMAEMMVEQASSLEHSRWQLREREEFFTRIVTGELDDVAQVAEWADDLGIDPNVSRVVAVFRWVGESTPESDELNRIQRTITSLDPGAFVPRVSPSELVAVIPVGLNGSSHDLSDKLVAQFPASVDDDLCVAFGAQFESLAGLRPSYLTAYETMEVGCSTGFGSPGLSVDDEATNESPKVFHYNDLEVAVLLSGLRGDWRGDRLAMPWRRLVEADTNGELVTTFNSYVAHFGDRKHCAEALHIHRNTLRYRLDRITTLTGLDLSKLPDLLKLYIGPLVENVSDDR